MTRPTLLRILRTFTSSPSTSSASIRITQLSLRSSEICRQCRLSSTTARQPQNKILNRLRLDLKSAMQAKDTPTLSVLRALLAAITNASKTSTPVTSDSALYSLISKAKSASKNSIAEFRAAGREDLAAKEEEQVRVLERYEADIGVVNDRDVEEAVSKVVQTLKEEGREGQRALGEGMKRLFGEEGVFWGRAVEKEGVVSALKRALRIQ
jgi:uncharacterized protein